MAKIFISYRRDDSPYAAESLYTGLVAHFGSDSVFFDEDTIPPGIDFEAFLGDAVSNCEILLAVIGNNWKKERLQNPEDWVRIEIEAALKRDIPIIPVLLRDAQIPQQEELPASLWRLRYRQGVRLRAGRDFRRDVQDLIQGIERAIEHKAQGGGDGNSKPPVQASPTKKPDSKVQAPSLIHELGIEMVQVEGGSFQMGSNDYNDEKPIHKVQLSSYEIGKYPVTQAQWEKLMGSNPSLFKGCANCPVEKVSWKDAQQFIAKLNQETGEKFSLPTEAQWEYAARGGKKSKGFTYAGSNNLEEVGWYWDNSRKKTHPIGGKKPNELGIYDMSGNVWEWCEDWYGADLTGPLNNPRGPETGLRHVLRGGGWSNLATYARVANRNGIHLAYRSDNYGLRIAKGGT